MPADKGVPKMVIKESYDSINWEVPDALWELQSLVADFNIVLKSTAESSENSYFQKNLFRNKDQAISYVEAVKDLKVAVSKVMERFAEITHITLD